MDDHQETLWFSVPLITTIKAMVKRMAEVNEEILLQYLKVVKRWFAMVDIPFKVPQNYSNIDILAYDPVNDRYFDFEVKYRSAYSLTNNADSINWMSGQFDKYKKEREKKISEFIGRRKTTKVLTTTYKMLGMSASKRNEMERRFKNNMQKLGYKSAIWYFDEIIPILVDNIEITGRYNTELLQTIRMLKVYKPNNKDNSTEARSHTVD